MTVRAALCRLRLAGLARKSPYHRHGAVLWEVC